MEMFDTEKLDRAVGIIHQIAEGKDPLTGEKMEEDALLNDPVLIRDMFFIKEVLQAVRRNDGKVSAKTSGTGKKKFPLECLAEFEYEKDKPISRFLDQLKELAHDPNVKGIGTKSVTDWLRSMGFLEDHIDSVNNKKETVVTARGIDFGLYMQPRVSLYGREYTVILYGRSAQEYIVRNMEAILNGEVL